MSDAQHDSSWRTLVGHFFRSFFRLNFLDDAGEESFRRAMIGLLSGIIALGLFFARLFMAKYAGLSRAPSPDPYRLMVAADQLLMICLSGCAVALITSLILPSIFPDETDFRTLMALPISRRSIFSAKVVALFMFAAIFIGISCLGFGAPFTIVSQRHWATQPLPARLLAHLTASIAACSFIVFALIAIQGLVVVLAPRRWLQRLSVAVQTTLICGVVLSLPLVSRAPTLWSTLDSTPRWLFAVPPAWFLGLQEWTLGARDSYTTALAAAAAAGTAFAVLVAAVCYAVAYQRFDQTVLRRAIDSRPPWWRVAVPAIVHHHPGYDAVRAFTMATLYRSGFHQLVFGGTFAAGLALATDRLLANVGAGDRWFFAAVTGAPLTLMAGAVIGLRLALLLPTNLRAAWIFRFAEDDQTRRYQLDAVRWTFFSLGVVLPALLAVPLHAYVFGLGGAAASFPVVLLLGWILTEMFSIDWRRIPFTCTFLFAKRPPAYTVLMAIVVFGWFVLFGRLLVQSARSGFRPWAVIVGVLTVMAGLLTRYRRATWGQLPLEFEDYLPDAVNPLRLGP
jgi:hypothetical protein